MTAVPLEEALERRAAADAVGAAVAAWSVVMLALTMATVATIALPDRPSAALVALVGAALIASPVLMLPIPARAIWVRVLFAATSILGLVVFTVVCSSGVHAGDPAPGYAVTLGSAAFVAINTSVTWRTTTIFAIPALYAVTIVVPIVFVVVPAHAQWVFDLFTAITAATLVVIVVVLRASRKRAQAAFDAMTQIRASVERGAQQDQLEARASAIVHDTVLNELAVLATTPPGQLRPEVRRQLESTLSQLSREDWLLGASASAKPAHSAFDAVIERCRLRGLEVTVSGERELVTALAPDVASQLFLAVEQCLANVLKHSGRTEAEVVVLGSPDEVSIMVIDDGVGFTEPSEPGDRIGLRASVRARLEELGGTAQVWSTPGAGTSVVLTVPAVA